MSELFTELPSSTFEEYANNNDERKRSRKDFLEGCEDWQACAKRKVNVRKCNGSKVGMECTDPECPMVIIGREVRRNGITFWRVDREESIPEHVGTCVNCGELRPTVVARLLVKSRMETHASLNQKGRSTSDVLRCVQHKLGVSLGSKGTGSNRPSRKRVLTLKKQVEAKEREEHGDKLLKLQSVLELYKKNNTGASAKMDLHEGGALRRLVIIPQT